ncbi:MAG: hypothetical protein HY738_21000 [Bacteroidia bacterium]|nr:hypothetical protein [Bacteroidia bacterium]
MQNNKQKYIFQKFFVLNYFIKFALILKRIKTMEYTITFFITLVVGIVTIIWFIRDIRKENSKVLKSILDVQKTQLEVQDRQSGILLKIEEGQRKGFESLEKGLENLQKGVEIMQQSMQKGLENLQKGVETMQQSMQQGLEIIAKALAVQK